MGLFIHLYVNFHQLDEPTWEKMYHESLYLLQNFPAPLINLKREERLGQMRNVYTSDIIEDKDTRQERWTICGDMVSYRVAESFSLPRYLNRFTKSDNDLDVLWADETQIDYTESNGRRFWGNKTQGYPYHLALLAVGILFESRFPQQAFVIGDIDPYQVEHTLNWMNTILDVSVTTPVCVDGPRLYQRLVALYDKPELAIARFKTLYRASEEESMTTLFACAGEAAVMADFREDLAYYQSLHQLGAIDLVAKFLAVTKNITLLVDLVTEIAATKEDKTAFSLSNLLEILVKKYITLDFPARQPLSMLAHQADDLTTIDDIFAMMFMKLGGAPSAVEFYISAAELLELFARYQPAERSRFSEIITQGEAACWAELKATQDLINQATQAGAEESEGDTAPIEAIPTVAADNVIQPQKLSPEAAYILDQAAAQRINFQDPINTAKHMGAILQQGMEKHAALFTSADKAYYLEKIYWGSHECGFVLNEAAWEQIDAEQDLAILKHLALLAMINQQEQSFWRWRIYLLEHKALWPYLL